MRKKIKVTIFLIITIILATTILVLPKFVKAAGIGTDKILYAYWNLGGENSATITELKNKGAVKITPVIFKSDSVFCVESDQHIFNHKDSNGDWTGVETYILEKQTIKTGETPLDQGLAYILSHKKTVGLISETGKNNSNYLNALGDPTQLALYAYLKDYANSFAIYNKYNPGNALQKIMPEAKDYTRVIINDKNKYIEYRKLANGTEHILGGNNANGKKAYEYYYNATLLRDGTSIPGDENNFKYYATLHIFRDIASAACQKLIILEDTPTKRKTPDVYVPFKKVDQNGIGVSEAKIKITAVNNVKSISPITLTSAGNGSFGSIKVTPKENLGYFTIRIEETSVKDGYKKFDEAIEVEVDYDKITGKYLGATLVKFGGLGIDAENSPYGKLVLVTILYDSVEPGLSLDRRWEIWTTDENKVAFQKLIKKFPGIEINQNDLETFKQYKNKKWYLCIDNNLDEQIIIKNQKLPDVKLDFEKIDQSGKPVKGAKFTLIAGDNVAKISKTVITSDANGDFEDITITPKENTGTFKIKVKEQAPSGYMGFAGEIELEVKYNTDTGAVTSIKRISGEDCITTSNGTIGIVKVENKKIPKIDLRLRKLDENNVPVEGAKFQVVYTQDGKVLDTREATSKINDKGSAIVDFNPDVQPKTDSDVIATIKEIEAPNGYKLLEEEIVLKFTYTIGEDGIATWIATEEKDPEGKVEITQHSQYPDNSDVLIVVNVVNKSVIEKLTLLKTDSQDNAKVQGAKFKITFSNVESIKGFENIKEEKFITVSTDANGQIVLEDVVIADATKPIEIIMEEIEAPIGYKKIDGKITITITRKGNSYTINTTADDTILKEEFSGEVSNIKLGDLNLDGKITAVDARWVEQYINGERTFDDQQKIIADVNMDGKIDQTDTSTILKIAGGTLPEGDLQTHQIALNIKDIPIMNLGGIAWLDAQQDEKDAQLPNGIIDNKEERLAGIKVELYKGDTKVTKDVYGKELMIATAGENSTITYTKNNGKDVTNSLEKGEYVFPNVERGTDYYVVFTFDGINYKTVPISSNIYENNNESKVEEVNRQAFNDKFKTISNGTTLDTQDKSYSKANGLDSELEYKNNNDTNKEKQTATLITKDENNNVLSQYAMTAKSKNYVKQIADWKGTWNSDDGTINKNNYALDINCGLIKKFFDLALGTDVYSAQLKINDKSTTYNYNQIIDGANLDEFLNNNVTTNSDIIYNLYLYASDYNFRISDYVTDDAGSNKMNSSDAETIAQNSQDTNKELRAFVTYKVILYNQSTYDAKVNEIAYYYDNNYKFISATDAKGKEISFSDDSSLPQISGKTSARVSGFGENLVKGNDYRQELYFTFEVKKTEQGLPEKIKNGGLECANLAEILSYTTTEGGLIDNDSAPGNMVIGDSVRHEDDSDEAQGINISIRDSERHITGTVFDDSNKDGSTEGETPVNDVIVQLIEIKTVKGQNFEYIWQETRSGSNSVKTTGRNGYAGETYTTDVSGTGNYKFEGYIPGNYIIRYIYGDGRTYDVTDNVKKYNGQDYKSTIDNNYRLEWYNNAGYTGNTSVARDNEARRLEVMAYSTTINGEVGTALSNKTDEALTNTWMAAETSKINIPVDTDDKSTISSDTTVSFRTITNTLYFDNMNFGLALRPQTKLVLEKHITGLIITKPEQTVQPILVDAKADINQIINEQENNIELSGNRAHLKADKSTRENRGLWQLETDAEELAQGANLQVEYTYVVKNEGEEDYLNENLVATYKENINNMQKYNDQLKTKASEIKESTKGNTHLYNACLGEFYYTGNKGANDAQVLSRVEGLQEALNNELEFDSEVAGTDFRKINADPVDKNYYDAGGNLQPIKINNVVESGPTRILTIKGNNEYIMGEDNSNTDYSKTIRLKAVLSSFNNGEPGCDYPSYIAEITEYTNAAGRRNIEAIPANLSYVHSNDTERTMENSNEVDEFWSETIKVGKPTGADKITPIQITIIAVSSVAVIGVAIILIKKFVLKK